MQQTIQFDTLIDPVSTVLRQVARAYGYTGVVEAMAGSGSPLKVPARKSEITWMHPSELAAEQNGEATPEAQPEVQVAKESLIWTPKRTREFIHNLTIPAQRGMALLVVKGDVTIAEMCSYLDVESMQGVFSTIGAAVRNTRGLPREERPYFRYRSPEKFYRLNPELRPVFRQVYEESSRVRGYLEQAVQYADLTMSAARRG